jgi:hypothetical protein
LLLHPYYDRPDHHLEFVEEGYMRARRDSPRGKTTIEVLGLNRRGLMEARRDRLVTVDAALVRIRRLEDRIEQYPADASFRIELRQELDDLQAMLEPGQAYSALVAHRVGAAE